MSDSTTVDISPVQPVEQHLLLSDLISLLQDAVASGASVGFLPPLDDEQARDYWQTVCGEVAQGTVILLVAREQGQVVGSVQLALATKPNALHRAEVQKLFVLQTQRRRALASLSCKPSSRSHRNRNARYWCSIHAWATKPSRSIAR